MSRTDVHRPWIVQENDPHARHRMWGVQNHFHYRSEKCKGRRVGPQIHTTCDLWEGRDQRGPRPDPWCVFFPARPTCGCRMCTGHHERRAARRSERRYWSAALAQAGLGFDDADVKAFSRRW